LGEHKTKIMAHPAVAILESALRDRKLDRTLTTALAPLDQEDATAVAPLGIAVVDACLQGGLPRGQLSELVGPCSSGRMTLLLQFMAAATARGEIVALVDTCDRLDVASAAASGIDLHRFLWIRGATVHGVPTADFQRQSVDRALKALNLVLQSGGFGVVALDLTEISPSGLRDIPLTTWPRVQRVIEGRDTACVLMADAPLARSAGGLTVSLTGRAVWAGASARSRRMDGIDVRVRVVSPRKRIDGDVRVRAAVANDG
jgi:hypothetical protein